MFLDKHLDWSLLNNSVRGREVSLISVLSVWPRWCGWWVPLGEQPNCYSLSGSETWLLHRFGAALPWLLFPQCRFWGFFSFSNYCRLVKYICICAYDSLCTYLWTAIITAAIWHDGAFLWSDQYFIYIYLYVCGFFFKLKTLFQVAVNYRSNTSTMILSQF